MRRVLRREDRAWNELIRRYRALIYRCITKVTSKHAPHLPSADIDEIYSEILSGLWRNDMHKLRQYDPSRGTKLGSWLGMLAVNAAYDYLRGAGRGVQFDAHSHPVEVYAESGRTPLDAIMEKERWHNLRSALDEFSERDLQFLELYYDQGLEPLEIAESMAITLKTVYSKKHKIRASLRRGLVQRRQSYVLADLLRTA